MIVAERDDPLPGVNRSLEDDPIGPPGRQPAQPQRSEAIEADVGLINARRALAHSFPIWVKERSDLLDPRSPIHIVAAELRDVVR
jgi:hypothetical protein